MDKVKPFDIPKREVWEAFKKVKANQGAAGVDGQSIADFEADLTNNLYELWNRLSSGSYFPPPVRRVDIPKMDGGTRPLGIPTVTDLYRSGSCPSLLGAAFGAGVPCRLLWLQARQIGDRRICFCIMAFDMWMARRCPHIPFERYADDAICHCKSAEEAQVLWSALADRFAACKLVLHPEKTKIVYISSSPGELERVFQTMLEKAVRICQATFGNIYRWDGHEVELVASPPCAELVSAVGATTGCSIST